MLRTFATVPVIAMAALALSAPADAALPALVFEDRNGNGSFDGSDVNITTVLRNNGIIETTHDVVFTGGTFAAPLMMVDTTGNITVLSSLKGTTAAGTIALTTMSGDGTITIADNATLRANDQVLVVAGGDLVVGRRVTIRVPGEGSPNGHIGLLSMGGDVRLGRHLTIEARREVYLVAMGRLAIAQDARLTSTQRQVALWGSTRVGTSGCEFRARTSVVIASEGFVECCDSKVRVNRHGGEIQIMPGGAGQYDLSGSTFNVTPTILG